MCRKHLFFSVLKLVKTKSMYTTVNVYTSGMQPVYIMYVTVLATLKTPVTAKHIIAIHLGSLGNMSIVLYVDQVIGLLPV